MLCSWLTEVNSKIEYHMQVVTSVQSSVLFLTGNALMPEFSNLPAPDDYFMLWVVAIFWGPILLAYIFRKKK